MRKTILFISLSFFTYSTSFAKTILSCKKRHPIVYSSFYWVQINQAEEGDLSFNYANGIDTQMLEIYFSSPVTKDAKGNYNYQDADYSLQTELKKSELKFTLKNKTQNITRKQFHCE